MILVQKAVIKKGEINMRKKFTIFLILIFVLGLIPVNFSSAITQNQINAEVQIVCPDNYGNWWSGSGTIIDSKGIILTNKHVVTDQYGIIINSCFVGFIDSISEEPNFGTIDNPNLAEVKYYTTSNDMDAAILYLDNPTNKTYSYIDIWNSDSDKLRLGEKIEVIGFPNIGGSTITYTSGDFSGYGSSLDGVQNYIKTTAPLEHGNSGGAAYNSIGQFIGVPTMVIVGTLNSLSYILSVNSVKSWLSNLIGKDYSEEITEYEPIIELPEKNIEEDVTPPDISKISLQFYDCSSHFPERDAQGNVHGSPTKNGVKGDILTILTPNECTPISYDINKYFTYEPQTLYVKLEMPDYILNDIYTLADFFSEEMIIDPLKKIHIASGMALELTYHNGFFRPSKFFGKTDEGTFYFSLQVADRSGNISDTKIWQYNYSILGSENIDYSFAKKQAGLIFLQVEENGEAHYIYPNDDKRYYLGRPTDAFNIMRQLGLGATHNFITSHTIYPDHVLGKILLDVEQNGEAYYIYPKDKKAYYLGRPADAFRVMRELGLGITNNDLAKIPEGSL